MYTEEEKKIIEYREVLYADWDEIADYMNRAHDVRVYTASSVEKIYYKAKQKNIEE